MRKYQNRNEDAEIVACDFSDPIVESYKLGYDENHDIVIIDNGPVDLQARIDAAAAHVPSLSELCAGLPGSTPLQQLQAAIDTGLLSATDTSGDVVDLTDVPESIGDFARTGQAAKAALGTSKDIASLVDEIVKARLAEIEAAKAAEAEKGETK